MTVTFKKCNGDIFESSAEAIVNAVNCVGVMGAGLAAAFKKRYPDNFKQYKLACDEGYMRLGKICAVEDITQDHRYIINFPTKGHWKNPSTMTMVEDGLDDLLQFLKNNSFDEIKSIAIPALGCGLGGLSWPQVEKVIVSILSEFNLYDIEIELYPPH